MHGLDIVRVIVAPRSTHSLWVPMVRNHVVVVSEFFMADRADASLFSDFSVVMHFDPTNTEPTRHLVQD
jgi:hypothetical protein